MCFESERARVYRHRMKAQRVSDVNLNTRVLVLIVCVCV